VLATVLSLAELRPGAFDLRLEPSEPCRKARAGQFAHILCGPENLLRRPISLCDQREDMLRFVFEKKGAGTSWLARRRPGETVDLLFPLGRGFTANPDGPPTLLVGGGAGVPPMVYAARRLNGTAHAVTGFRTAGLAMLLDDLNALCPKVEVCSDDGSLGARGFVDAVCRRLMGETAYARVLACGPKPMLRAVAAAAAEFDVPCEVSLEERMGCGLGACLGCACRTKAPGGGETYSRVCQDGPVFDAGEVIW
jgi:dihydroorotate dehydrogenase electron transfer subunit